MDMVARNNILSSLRGGRKPEDLSAEAFAKGEAIHAMYGLLRTLCSPVAAKLRGRKGSRAFGAWSLICFLAVTARLSSSATPKFRQPVIPLANDSELKQTGSGKDGSKAADIWIPAVVIRQCLIAGMTLLCLLLTTPTHAQDCGTPPTNGLAGHWTLNETSGTTAADTSGSGNNLTMQNGLDAANDSSAGAVNTAINFDGADDRAHRATTSGLSPTGDITVSAWIRSDQASQDGKIVAQQNGADGYKLGLYTNQKVEFEIRDGTGPTLNRGAAGGTIIQPGIWYHVVGMYSDSGDFIRTYVNGQFDREETTASVMSPSTGGAFAIGTESYNSNNPFSGTIDDVRVYDRILSEEEISQLYEYGLGDEGAMVFDQRHASMKYCNGTDWVHAGLGPYIPNAVTFDGTNDYFTHAGALTGATDTKLFSGSLWFRRNTSGTTEMLMEGLGFAYRIQIDAGDDILISAENSSGTEILSNYNNSLINDTNWHHLMFSFDMSDINRRHIYVDGVSDIQLPDTFIDDFIDATVAGTSIGGGPTGSLKFSGDLADFWIDFGTYIDLSDEANRRKFISENGMPVYLGENGSLPTGAAPDIFLTGDTANWHTNKGTGGGFTENGEITYSSSRPGDDVIESGAGNYLVNSASRTQFGDATGQTFNFGFTPASGNLLVVAASWDKVISGLSEASGQWTQIAFETSTTSVSGVMYYKISDGTETSITLNWTNSEDMSIWVGEYQGLVNASVLNQSASANSGGTAVTSQSSGTTGATTAAETLAIAMFGSDTGQNTESGRSYSNGFNEITYLCPSCNGSPGLAVVNRHLLSTGTVETTFSNADSGDQQVGIIGVFEKDPNFVGGAAGAMEYDTTFNVMKYHNGAEWVAMGPIGGRPSDTGLVGYWMFDEGSGTTANDSSGNGNNATVSGGTPAWGTGILGNSVADAWFRRSGPTGLSSTEVTLSVWTKMSSDFDYSDAITFNWGSGTGGYVIYGDASGDVNFGIMDGGNQRKVWGVRTGLEQWQHWAGTYDGNTIKLYIDGKLMGTNDGYPGITLQTTGDLYIGDGDAPMAVDEARVYSRALSAAEIQQLYYYGVSGGLGDVDNACASPVGEEGEIFYNADFNVMQYCNGEQWIGIGQ